MAELLYNYHGRILVVLVILFDAMVVQSSINNSNDANMVDGTSVSIDSVSNDLLNSIAGRPVPSCEHANFCETPPYYLSDADVQKALANKYLEPINEDQMIFPKTATDGNRKWHWILNTKGYRQGVKVATCSQANCQCASFLMPDGYETSCKQQYSDRGLVAYDHITNAPKMVFTPIPSGCTCYYRFRGADISASDDAVGEFCNA